ncbi:hypothetical protein ACIRYZ_43130 [Kitasatospora sp. NPDC101155]|uniref:hypothetical protein n=1 Tax=Kitasatospora sp. NPDC101155 TaxID=3364097 RepID=UPI0037F9FFAA
MATTFNLHAGVASSIAQVETHLAELQQRKASLEAELTQVGSYIDAMNAALHALRSVPTESPQAPADDTTVSAAAPEEPVKASGEPGPAAEETASKKAAARRRPAARAAAGGGPSKRAARSPRKAVAAAVEAAPATSEPTAKTSKKTTATKKAAAAPAQRSRGVADEVLAALASAGTPLKAGEITAAIGRDDTSNNVANVRATLERLVKAGRAQRSGRGLFVALTQR